MKLIDHELQWNAPIKFTNPFHLQLMERSLDRNEIGCRRLNGRPKEKYPRKQLSEK
jgi:hypothetical protein